MEKIMRAANGPETHSNVGVCTAPLVCIRHSGLFFTELHVEPPPDAEASSTAFILYQCSSEISTWSCFAVADYIQTLLYRTIGQIDKCYYF